VVALFERLVLLALASFAIVTPHSRASIGERACEGVEVTGKAALRAAIANHPSGTTFCLAPGTYRVRRPFIPKSDDTFIGAPGTVLNGSRRLRKFVRSKGFWVARRQRQKHYEARGVCDTPRYTGCKYGDDVFFDNRPLRRVMRLSQLRHGRFYFNYPANKIYLADNPHGHKVEAAIGSMAFRGQLTAVANVVIRGLVVEKFAVTGINAARTWVIQGNEVRLNHGIGIHGGEIVRGNYVHDNGQIGIVGNTATGVDLLYEDNEIARNNYARFKHGWEAGGGKWMRIRGLAVRRNYVHDNKGPGLWTDTENFDVVYEQNRVVNNTGAGIFHELSYDAVIRNNVVRGNGFKWTDWLSGAGILISSSANVQVYGNTVSRNADGIGITHGGHRAGTFGLYEPKNIDVHDNTVTMMVGATGLATGHGSVYFTRRANRFQNNTYYLGCGNSHFAWLDPRDGVGYAYITKEQWVADGNDTTGSFTSICR
jgi:parallel beta-helix repeat protein